jgi:hypothetical protein
MIVGLAVILSCGSLRAQEAETPAGTNEPAATPAPAAVSRPAVTNANLRTWKSASGAVIEAEFVEAEYGQVLLKGKDGKPVKIGKAMLSKEDQAWITAQGGETAGEDDVGTGAVTPPATPNLLPTYADGKWKGYNAVYQDPSFDAAMDMKGIITVFPKVDGKRTGKSLTYSLCCYFIDTSKKPPHHTGREVRRYEDPPAPQMQPKEIAMKGQLRDDVPFEVTFAFKGNKISSYGWLKDPEGLRDPTVFRTGVWVPKSHDIPLQMKMPEQRELLKDYEVRVKPVDGKLAVYPYSSALNGGEFSLRAKEVQVIGPIFGDRKIRVIGQSTEKAPIRPWIYAGFAPWQGFFIGLYKDEPDSRATSQRMVLIID